MDQAASFTTFSVIQKYTIKSACFHTALTTCAGVGGAQQVQRKKPREEKRMEELEWKAVGKAQHGGTLQGALKTKPPRVLRDVNIIPTPEIQMVPRALQR